MFMEWLDDLQAALLGVSRFPPDYVRTPRQIN